jgi:predicted metal-dependent peptidase
MDTRSVETKLAAARTRLILDKPFLGALVLRLPLVAADPQWCRTTATDARSLYYNPQYIEALGADEAQFVLAHEALHCALSHFSRRAHRLRHRWDIACDYAINPLLVQEGLTPPPGSLLEPSFEGMTAEEIYPCLDDNTDKQDTLDEHLYDHDEPDEGGRGGRGGRAPPQGASGAGGGSAESEADLQRGAAPPPLSASEREALSVQWRQRLAGAAQQAMRSGKLGGAMARMVDFLLQPQLPWRMLLARYMTALARDDYSYTRPSARRGGPAILPSLRSTQINLVVALDVSGSVSGQEMAEFLGEVDALKGQLRARITLQACDAELARDGPWCFEPWEAFVLPRRFQGGGCPGCAAGPAAVLHRCPGRIPGPAPGLSGDLAGQGQGRRALGPAHPAQLMGLSSADSLRLHVLLRQALQAVRIDKSRMQVHALTEQGEARVVLNPNCKDDAYLKQVRQLLSSHVLGSPGGYPVYLKRWTRMGQARKQSLERLLLLGEPEAVAAVVHAPDLTEELARRAWWAVPSADNARRMLACARAADSPMGPVLAHYLVDYLPFEQEPQAMIDSVRLVLRPGLIDARTRAQLWGRCQRKNSYYVGFLQALPDALPVQISPHPDWERLRGRLAELCGAGNPYAVQLLRVLGAPGQAFLDTAERVLHKPNNQDVVVALLEAVGAYFAPVRPDEVRRRRIEAVLADAEALGDAGAERPEALRELRQTLPGFDESIRAMLVLSMLSEQLVAPIFGLTDAIGTLMRRKIEPVAGPILAQFAVLRGRAP